MYFESKTHQLIECANANDAAHKIKTDFKEFHVAKWTSLDRKHFLYAVPDGHVDNPKFELAILRSATEAFSPLQQVESITNGWIQDEHELAKYLEKAETSNFIMNNNVNLIIGKPRGHEIAWFDCGCCGLRFRNNVQYQSQFSQDSGYGICKRCEKHYL